MKRRVDGAIKRLGGVARSLETGETFAASIQPELHEGDGHTEIGTGFFRRFTMYTVCDDTAGALREGSRIECGGIRYVVRSIETYCFRGKPVFRRGVIIMEQEDDGGKSDGA